MIHRCTYTHYGWIGVCPVYIADPYSETPTIDARRWWLEPLHDFSIMMFGAVNFIMACMNPGHEDYFPLWISGELDKPITQEYDDGCD